MQRFSALQCRDRRPELMDDPRLEAAEHVRALIGLARINSISGTVRTLWKAMQPLASRHDRPRLRILDIACGGGDVAVGLWQRSVRCGLPVDVAACDVSPTAIEHARLRAASAGADVRFFEHNVLESPPGEYDIVCCSLFLHHLDERDALDLLGSMRQAAQNMVLVSDLIRSRAGYALAWCGARILTRSPIVHTDGPLSVRAAFTEHEALALARRAGMAEAILVRHWPKRFLLKWQAP